MAETTETRDRPTRAYVIHPDLGNARTRRSPELALEEAVALAHALPGIEIVGDEVVVNGRVVGRVRGLKVRLSATARVEGDIVHKTIAIESGAHFEGSVQRQEDPLGNGVTPKLAPPMAAKPALDDDLDS